MGVFLNNLALIHGRSNDKPTEIIASLEQFKFLAGQETNRIDAIRQVNIPDQTYYRWRKQYGGKRTYQLRDLSRYQNHHRDRPLAHHALTFKVVWSKEAYRGSAGEILDELNYFK